jgi:hypothetical protein
MKQLFFLFCLCIHIQLSAQEFSLKRDIVYADKLPVCKFLTIGTITNQAYTIKNMQDEELILIDQSQLRNAEGNALLRFMFADMPKAEAFMPVSLGFKKQLARLIVTYNLIQDGKLNPKGVDRFCRNYNGYMISNRLTSTLEQSQNNSTVTIPEQSKDSEPIMQAPITEQPKDVVVNSTTEISPSRDQEYEFPIVERDPEQQVFLSGTTIRQDFKDIGTYSAETKTVDNQEGYLLTIKDINGVKIAEATYANGAGECDLITLKDQKTRRVTIPKADVYTVVKDVVSKLSFLLYL